MNQYAAGALAGFLATIPMSLAMARLHRRLPVNLQYPLPPYGITSTFLAKTGVRPAFSVTQERYTTLALHFGFGAFAGAITPLVLRSHHLSLARGACYGVGVWAASYQGWVPGLSLHRAATRQPRERVGLMVAAHLVWGASLAAILQQQRSHGPGRRLRPA